MSDQEERISHFPRILNAMYFQGELPDGLYPSISSVNTFRLVFNQAFGADLPLLADHSFYSDADTPYALEGIPASCSP